MWRCLVFVVAVTMWNLAGPAEAVPLGENTCQGVVKHPVKVKVNVTEPVTFRTYTWCLRVPPRCSKFVVQMRERIKEQIEMHNRTITVCCRGFVEMESKCVPACPPMTECPNMHCNRTNHCYCSPGYSGVFCNDPCPKGSWGKDCKKPCDCPDGFTCHHLTGDCMLDDKPSIKTTVRRAFTHISSSESIPTTSRSVTTSNERIAQTSIPVSTLKATPLLPSPTTLATTHKPYTENTKESVISTEKPVDAERLNPSLVETPIPTAESTTTSTTSTSTTTTTTTTTTTAKPTMPTVKETTTSTTFPTNSSTLKFETTTRPSFSQQSSPNVPTVGPMVTSFDNSESLLTTSTTSVKTLLIPETASVPLHNDKETIDPAIKSNSPFYFDEKASTLDVNYFTTAPIEDKISKSLLSTVVPISEATPSEENNSIKELEVSQSPISVPSTHNWRYIIPEPTLKVTTSPILFTQSTPQSVYVLHERATISPLPTSDETTPPLRVTTQAYPETLGLSTVTPSNENDKPYDFSTAPHPFHFDNRSVTDPVDAPLIPMQTPNRNWDPFIPSPDSTKSHSSLTIPFSVNIPVTEIITTTRTASTVEATMETVEPDFINLKTEPFTERRETYFNLTTVKPLTPHTKSSLANTFLHSFLKPTDKSVYPQEKIHFTSSFAPSTVNLINSVTEKEPLSNHNEREYIHDITLHDLKKKPIIFGITYTTPSFVSSTDKLTKEEDFKLQETNTEISPTAFALDKHFVTQPVTRSVSSTLDSFESDEEETTTSGLIDVHPFEVAFTAKPTEQTVEDRATTKTYSNSYSSPSDILHYRTSQGIFSLIEKSLGSTPAPTDKTLKPSMFSPNIFNPRIITADSMNPSMVDSGNILGKNNFVSFMRPKLTAESFPKTSTLVVPDTELRMNHFNMPGSNIASTYSHLKKTVAFSGDLSAHSSRNMLDNIESETSNFTVKSSKIPTTTPLTPKEINPIVNGKLLEEPSNYLPTINEKSTTQSQDFDLRDKLVKSTKEFFVTQPPQSGYLPTDKDFLNLTYILNSINDFTSNAKRGMKQSKASIYGNPVKVKITETPSQNNLVTNAIYDSEPFTEVFRPVSVFPTRKHWKQDVRGSHQHKDKNARNDSKIIHLNISSHLSFRNPTTKLLSNISSQINQNVGSSSHSGGPGSITAPIDGRITTVSMFSTVPLIKYQTKRSTKEYSQKTENAFSHSLTPDGFVGVPNSESSEQISDITYRPSSAIAEDSGVHPTTPMQPTSESEEISKKPFRRKDSTEPYQLEDVRPNMTAALAAHSSEKSPYVNITTGILATIICILLLGSLTSAAVIIIVYCKKEKPVPMESCIMAFEQTDTPDPAAIYSVPRASLMPEIFFCPTFTHHYAAQINKELRELSYGTVKREGSEPVYTEISTPA